MSAEQLNLGSEAAGVLQGEAQGLVILNSHDVKVTQTEAQSLALVQASLQAAIEASAVVLGVKFPALQLQAISEALGVAMGEAQGVFINNSDTIHIEQKQLQVDSVVQAAIQLLTQLSLTVAGAQ